MNEPDVDQIAADLRERGFHVDPGAEGWVPREQLEAIAAQSRETGIPVHVVLVPPEGAGIHVGDELLK